MGAIRVQVSACPRSNLGLCRAGAHFRLDSIAGHKRGAIRKAPEAHEVDARGRSILACQAGQASVRI